MKLTAIANRYQSGERIRSRRPSTTGMLATVHIVSFTGGEQYVIKTDHEHSRIDNEILSNHVAKVFGLNVPDMIRLNESTILMDFIPYPTAVELEATNCKLLSNAFRSQSYRRMRTFDAVVNNCDRHEGNFLVEDSETVWAIDHGGAAFYVNRYMRHIRDTGYSQDELEAIGYGLLQLRSAFEGFPHKYHHLLNNWKILNEA